MFFVMAFELNQQKLGRNVKLSMMDAMCYEGFVFEDFSCTYIRTTKQWTIFPLLTNYCFGLFLFK